MSNIVIYDPNDSIVPYRVIEFLESVNTPDYDSVPYKLINPDLSTLSNISSNYWKVSGSDVIEMTAIEKNLYNDSLITPPTTMCFVKPKSILIFNGYPSCLNSGTNQWSNELAAYEFSQYSIIVFGGGVEDSGHSDHNNTIEIISYIRDIDPNVLIFGSVDASNDITTVQTNIDKWDAMLVDGICLNKLGYDYNINRADLNTRIDYVHNRTNAKLCMASAWNPDHLIGIDNDESYPNTTYNASLTKSNLAETDWILMKNYAVDTDVHTSSTPAGYEDKNQWYDRSEKILAIRDLYNIKIAAYSIIADGHSNEQNLFNFGYTAAMMYTLNAYGSGDTSYGESSSKSKFLNRPIINGAGFIDCRKSFVKQCTFKPNVYNRFSEFGRFVIDFTSNSQNSKIIIS